MLRQGKDAITWKTLIDLGGITDFVIRSWAMKIILILAVIFIVASQAISNAVPALKPYTNIGAIFVIGITLLFIYKQYLIAVAVGFQHYSFLKIVVMTVAKVVVLIFLPTAYVIPILTSLVLTMLGFVLFFPDKFTIGDIIKIIVVGFIAGFITDVYILGGLVANIPAMNILA